jgi:hypothetical protein
MTTEPQTAAPLTQYWRAQMTADRSGIKEWTDSEVVALIGRLLAEFDATRVRSGLDAGLLAAVRAYLDESCPGESSCGRPHCDALRAALAREEADDGR